MTLTTPANARVALNSGRNPRSPASAGRFASRVATARPSTSIGDGVVNGVAVGRATEGCERRAVGGGHVDFATERGRQPRDDGLRAGCAKRA